MIVKKITRMALLSAIALAIFWVEAQIPVPIPHRGLSSLANVVTIFAVFALGPGKQPGIFIGADPVGFLVVRSNDGTVVCSGRRSLGLAGDMGLETNFNREADLGC